VELLLAGEDVRYALAVQPIEMGIGDLLGQQHDDRVAADVGAAPGDLAVGIEDDAVDCRIALGDPVLPWIFLPRLRRIGLAFGKFLAGDAADQPRIAAQLLMQALEQAGVAIAGRSPAAAKDAAIDARDHVADDVRLHEHRPYSAKNKTRRSRLGTKSGAS